MVYNGTEAPPDTFKDDSQALAEGTYGRDGVFPCQQTPGQVRLEVCPQARATAPRQGPPKKHKPVRPKPVLLIFRSEIFSLDALRRQLRAHDAGVARSSSTLAQPSLRRPMPLPVVSLQGIVRHFGRFAALRGITAEFAAGRLYLILGENGAGKSTLLRIMAGLLKPTRGSVSMLGATDLREVASRVGYMGHAPLLYDELMRWKICDILPLSMALTDRRCALPGGDSSGRT